MLISCQRKERKRERLIKGRVREKKLRIEKEIGKKKKKKEKNMCVDKWEEVRRKKGNKEKRVWRRAEDICLI